MSKITQRSLEQNWYRINEKAILEAIRESNSDAFERYHANAVVKPSLAALIAKIWNIDLSNITVQPGHYDEFTLLMLAYGQLDEGNPVKQKIDSLLVASTAKNPVPATDKESNLEDDADDNQPLLLQQPKPLPRAVDDKVAEPDAYKEGFEFAAKKREAARKNRLKWYLDYQLTNLQKLQDLAWWGKIRAIMYGLAVGIALAGFMLMFTAGQFGTAAMFIMGFTLVPFLAYFPAKANFWVTRRDPTQLSFDLMSPHEPNVERLKNDGWSDTTYAFLNTPFWGMTVKEILARIGGFLNATVYGGLTATGMWEFFSEFGLNTLYASYNLFGIPYAVIPCAIITFAMSRMVFKPELGLGVKFIRSWLNKNPFEVFREMNAKVNPNNELTNPYFLRFLALFSCIVIGGVFTSLSAADLVGSLTGGTGWAIKLGLSFLTISVIPFYYKKAVDNVVKVFDEDQAALKAAQDGSQSVIESGPKLFSFPWWVRRLNALMHAVPAFLGGLSTFSGIGGVAFGIFTALAGFGASFISGENGEEKGYEDEIQTEITETLAALNDPAGEWVTEEPQVEIEGVGYANATKHPYLLSMFNSAKETQDAALELLEARVSHVKQKRD